MTMPFPGPFEHPVPTPAPDPGPPGPPAAGGWDDWLRARLFEQRTVLVRGAVTDDVAGQASAELMTLDATGDERVHLHLDCGEGSVGAALALMDVVDLLGVPTTAVVIGRAEGPAMGVLAVADRRVVAPHAVLRLCEPRVELDGRTDDLARAVEHHRRQLERFQERVAAAARRPLASITEAMAAGHYLEPAEAIRLGLADEIGRPPPPPVRPLHNPGFGFQASSAR